MVSVRVRYWRVRVRLIRNPPAVQPVLYPTNKRVHIDGELTVIHFRDPLSEPILNFGDIAVYVCYPKYLPACGVASACMQEKSYLQQQSLVIEEKGNCHQNSNGISINLNFSLLANVILKLG